MISDLAISPAVPPNLFHRVMVLSGTAMSIFGKPHSPLENARDIAERAGLGANLSLDELNKGLLNLDTVPLVKAFRAHHVCTK